LISIMKWNNSTLIMIILASVFASLRNWNTNVCYLDKNNKIRMIGNPSLNPTIQHPQLLFLLI
jgi:hypothetical protein